jgi:hypothetical protein
MCLAMLLPMTVTNFLLKGEEVITLVLPALYFVPCSQVLLCPNCRSGMLSDGLTRELEVRQNTDHWLRRDANLQAGYEWRSPDHGKDTDCNGIIQLLE